MVFQIRKQNSSSREKKKYYELIQAAHNVYVHN